MLEGLLGLDLLPRRAAAGLPAGDVRAPGLRVRRQASAAPGWPGTFWNDPAFADRLEREAADLKRALQPRLLGRGRRVLRARARRRRQPGRRARLEHRAPALERHRRQVQGEGPRRAPARPRLFSGWGVRTLAEGEARYNPIGYHVGTVWPFDNSFIAWGLRRYGFKEEAARIAAGILDAAEYFDGPAARGVRRLRAGADEVPGAVPDRVQPAGVVDRGAAAAAAHDARARAARRAPGRRPGAAARESARSSCSTSRAGGAGSTPSGAGSSTSSGSGADLIWRRSCQGSRPHRPVFD